MSRAALFSMDQFMLMGEAGAFDGRHQQRVELIRGQIQQLESKKPFDSRWCPSRCALCFWLVLGVGRNGFLFLASPLGEKSAKLM